MGMVSIPYQYSRAPKRAIEIYKQVILGDHPVAYWPLDDTSGTVAQDVSGNGNNMAYQNAPTLGAARIASGLGASVNLNGTNQFVELNMPPALLQLVEGSFEIWCNQTTVNNGATLFGNIYSGSIVNFIIGQGWRDNSPPKTNYIYGGCYNSDAWSYAGYVSTLSANTPYHVVYTNDGTTSRLYINGALAFTGTGATFTPTTTPIHIGASFQNKYYVEGLLSNAAMYDTVLSAAKILNHYNAGIA